jgi:hypothetical protein
MISTMARFLSLRALVTAWRSRVAHQFRSLFCSTLALIISLLIAHELAVYVSRDRLWGLITHPGRHHQPAVSRAPSAGRKQLETAHFL